MTAMPPPQQTRQLGAQGAPAANPLPATGLQQQAASIRQQSMSAQLSPSPQATIPPAPGGAQASLSQPTPGYGATSLSQLAQKLATSYGLSVGRNPLVDAQGNFTMTPDQIAAQSGGKETQGSAAAKFNLIADAMQRQQQQQQMQKSQAALQAGLGLVQSRGRGSLAAMQSGYYQGLSNLYQNQQYQAADFSYFIQAQKYQDAMDLMNKQMRMQKKGALGGALGGIAGMLLGGPGGGAIGSSIGSQLGANWF